jgi:NAD+ diphosphatase
LSAPDQPSSPRAWPAGQGAALPFTGATIDRAAELRQDPEAISRLLSQGTPMVVAATADGVIVDPSGEPRLLRLALQGEAAKLLAAEQPILLGLDQGVPLVAVDLDGVDEIGAGGRLITLREAGSLLSASESGLAAYMVALLGWHRRHRFCANCGSPTDVAEAGLSRKCPVCGASHFPRTDPCVIMLVEHDGRILLGSRSGWPSNRYSILAGFVASGETPEEAVIREVKEESGIVAHSPRYLGAQPWPFPSSLMLGYEASADGGEPSARDGELTDARWFNLEEIRRAQSGDGELLLPGEVSIARSLIDAWAARGGRRL